MQFRQILEINLLTDFDAYPLAQETSLICPDYTVHQLRSYGMRWQEKGAGGRLWMDESIEHRLNARDFPLEIYLNWKINYYPFILAHELTVDYKKSGYYLEWDAQSDLKQAVGKQPTYRWVQAQTALDQLMTHGTYSISTMQGEVVAQVEAPYHVLAAQVLDEAYGAYYLSSTDHDEIVNIAYLPFEPNNWRRQDEKRWCIMKVRLPNLLEEREVKTANIFLTHRSIFVRYLFHFNHPISIASTEIFNQQGVLPFKQLDNQIMSNGAEFQLFESTEPLSLKMLFEGGATHVRFKENQSDSFSDSEYRLPDKIQLPIPQASQIRATNGRYQCELYVYF